MTMRQTQASPVATLGVFESYGTLYTLTKMDVAAYRRAYGFCPESRWVALLYCGARLCSAIDAAGMDYYRAKGFVWSLFADAPRG